MDRFTQTDSFAPMIPAILSQKIVEISIITGMIGFLLFLLFNLRNRHGKATKRQSVTSSNVIPFTRSGPGRADDMSDPAAQMEAISRVDFEPVRLLNREEAPLLPLLENCARAIGRGHRVMAQTSLGELIRPSPGSASREQTRRAHASINSKRLDFAIIDRGGRLVCAVEYQGSGHYHRRSFMRDAVKREALRKAGIALVEIPHGYNRSAVEQQVTRILSRSLCRSEKGDWKASGQAPLTASPCRH